MNTPSPLPSKPIISSTATDTKLDAIKKQIEKDTEEKVKIMNTHSVQGIQDILRDASDTFREKTGRPMTYGEMREMMG
jgi:hypothetical protein